MSEPSTPHPPGRGMPPGGLAPGTPVAGRFTKWGGGRHWEWVGRYLGADEHGHWWYAPAGTRCARPGMEFVSTSSWVSLAPHEGAYAVGFYLAHREVSVYVDMTTEPQWRRRDVVDADGGADGEGAVEWEVTMVDLDLDVVLTRDGHLFVDDEDEFAEHQVELGYPAEIVALAERWRDLVLASVAAGDEPFASVGHAWLRRADAGESAPVGGR
ncbi:DUF402 domain-containing protein [Terrabacter sp. C0L_2]|uniref:DUF402 domain-containing protein n=1 Tax=Terrabacter sp. C0L_2 TaxID=3108389 RepID=UPI002ED22496|nr:DUF402 domain-containing protein [Terrabacter sp. C0L_2]